MFCSKCGTQVPEGVTLCANCSAQAAQQPQAQQPQVQQPQVQPVMEQPAVENQPAGNFATKIGPIEIEMPDLSKGLGAFSVKNLLIAGLSFLTVIFTVISFFNWFTASYGGDGVTANMFDAMGLFFQSAEYNFFVMIASLLMLVAVVVFVLSLVVNLVTMVASFVVKKMKAISLVSCAAVAVAFILGFLACTLYGMAVLLESNFHVSIGLGLSWSVWITLILSIAKAVISFGALDSVLDTIKL